MIVIAGGGLAGLSCGITLRKLGHEVEIHERGRYPLKKVCGEFLSPLGWEICRELGIEKHLETSPVPLRSACFHYAPGRSFTFTLAPAAQGLTRGKLDTALAASFKAAGGRLHEGSRVDPSDLAAEDRTVVDARGREIKSSGPWFGWKGYVEDKDLPGAFMAAGLNMISLRRGYCGISRVEEGRWNVCLLARTPFHLEEVFGSHALLRGLLPRVEHFASISGFDLRHAVGMTPALDRLGDAWATWPPVVGDGMTVALKMGMDWARRFSRGESDWAGNCRRDYQPSFSRASLVHGLTTFSLTRNLAGRLFEKRPALASRIYQSTRIKEN